MKITSNETHHILTWADFKIDDGSGEEKPIKKITLTVRAGDLATLEVERYDLDGIYNTEENAITKTYSYCVDKVCIEAFDGTKMEQNNKKTSEENKELKEKRLKNLNSIHELEL